LYFLRFETCYQIALPIKEVEDLEDGGIQVSTAVFVYHLIKRTHVKHEHIQIFFQMVPFQVIQIDEAASREGLTLRKLEHALYLD
jgi:hypothetical protein